MQPAHWSRAWKRDNWLRRLSGLTLPPSTLDRGVAAFIASLPEIHARRTASPESGSVQQVRASLPPRSFGSLTSAGLIVSSERTFRGMRTGSSKLSSQHWSDWATALRLEYSARPALEEVTDASGSSSWPTPEAGQFGTSDVPKLLERRERYAEKYGNNGFGLTLGQTVAVMTWSTPRASDGEKGGPNMSFGAGGVPLPTQAAHWETPGIALTEGSRLTRGGDRSSELLLTGQAMALSSPSSAQAPATSTGPTSSPERRTLNPLFVEWLMGWPIGWTDCGSVEMEFTRWQQDMRGLLSTLCSRAPRQATLL